MQIQRREFLKRSAMGVSTLLVAPVVAKAAVHAPKYDPFEAVPLGKSGVSFSRVCMGTGMRGGNRQSNQTRMGKEKFEELLHGAFERGVRTFDMADLYGTHPYLLPALKGVPRKDYAIISKIWFRPGGIPDKDRPDADVVVNRFLKELGTDYIDLILLHCVESAKWPDELSHQMEILANYKKKGLIRAHGVSCHTVVALEAAANESWVDSVHARINPFGMSMDNPPEKVPGALKKIHDAGKGVVGMKVMGEGKLRNDDEKRDQSVKYVLELGCVDILNVGFEKLEEVDDFDARVRKVKRAA
jgi:aryl-alcohol dehydrogenase-like predicted oxidoreductase